MSLWDLYRRGFDPHHLFAMDVINPLLEAGIIEKSGTKKTGRYRLARTAD